MDGQGSLERTYNCAYLTCLLCFFFCCCFFLFVHYTLLCHTSLYWCSDNKLGLSKKKKKKDLQSQGKGEFKNKWLWQAVFRKFLFCSRGERMYRDSLSPSPPHLGILLKERICSLGEQVLSFKSNP